MLISSLDHTPQSWDIHSSMMESKHHDRGRSNSESSPVSPPSSSSIITAHCESSSNKNKLNTQRSPSSQVTDYHHRSGRSSRNLSPQDKLRRKKHRRSSRSSERSRKYSRRSRSRSKSRGGKSRSRERRRSNSFNRSASRSQSRSRTYSCSRSRSRSNSRSKSRSCNRNRDSNRSRHRDSRRHHNNNHHHHHSNNNNHHHHHRHYRETSYESDNVGDIGGVDRHQSMQNIQPILPAQSNAFKNDGSFMEMFKKMQESMQQPSGEKPTTSVLEEKPVAPPPLMVGKRRGGRILKTGMVAKPKAGQTVEQPKDAWSLYMAEVKKYREVCCQEEDNTRPLVK